MDPYSVEKNFGTWTHLGTPLSQRSNGDLCTLDGLPTGLTVSPGGYVVRSPQCTPARTTMVGVPGSSTAPQPATPSHEPSLVSMPIYLWMVFLGLVAGIVVSGSTFVIPAGLHLHPVYGVAVAFSVVGLYRYLMTWFPTGLAVTLVSTSVWAMNVWAWRHAAQLRDLPTQRSEALVYVATLLARFQRSTWVTPDLWVLGTVVAGLTLHFVYWRHRRQMAAQHGWIFNRGLSHAARVLFKLASTSLAIGLLIAWLR